MGCCDGDSEEDKHRMTRLERSDVCCTDIFFLIFFILFIIVWAVLCMIAVHYGDSKRLIHGYDSFGNVCNSANNKHIKGIAMSGMNTTGLDNVFFMSYWTPLRARQICVRTCPTKKLLTMRDIYEFGELENSSICDYSVKSELKDIKKYTRYGPCPSLPVLKSVSMFGRCIPEISSLSAHFDEKMMNPSQYVEFLKEGKYNYYHGLTQDVRGHWQELLMFILASIFVSVVIVVLLRIMASVIIWSVVVVALSSSAVITIYLWYYYFMKSSEMKTLMAGFNEANRTMITAKQSIYVPIAGLSLTHEHLYLFFAIVFSIVLFILVVMVIAMRDRLELVIDIFYEAGKCIIDIPFLLVQPIITFSVLLLFIVCWLLIYAFISTLGEPTINYKAGHERVIYVPSGFHKFIWWYHVIALIWISEFILACQQFIIGGAVGMWYFTRNKKNITSPIFTMNIRLFSNHIGSVAFGSFVILCIRLPRYILMYIDRELNQSGSDVSKVLLKCCVCCLYILEKFLKFINQNAYALIAIEGLSFCNAAIKSFQIITTNILRVAILNSVGDFVLFLGKLAICCSCMFISLVYFKRQKDVNNYFSLVGIIGIFSYYIGHCFLEIYEMVVDTILLCFCEDSRMMDSIDGARTYTNDEFNTTMRKANRKMESAHMIPYTMDMQNTADTQINI